MPPEECHPPIAVPREPLVDIATIHPTLEKMARGICLADGYHEDEHWFDYDEKSKVDRGGPAWTFYLERAEHALKALLSLDNATLMRGTAAFSHDTPLPAEDLGDPDYVEDLDRAIKTIVGHILKPYVRP